MTAEERELLWSQISALDPTQQVVACDRAASTLTYSAAVRSDESRVRRATDEELVRALTLCTLCTTAYGYAPSNFYIERYYKHGHPASKHDEVDFILYDTDDLAFAMWEFKAPGDYEVRAEEYIRYQLFGTAPLIGAPKLLVYGTVLLSGGRAGLTVRAINYELHQSYESWVEAGRPHSTAFPASFRDPDYAPLIRGSANDLRSDASQAVFRAIAATFHSEFFAEHPDNTLFVNLLKCLLAKIYDERVTKQGRPYSFQVLYVGGREESALDLFRRVNALYRTAYTRYIESGSAEPDEISDKEFAPERVKTVVKVLQRLEVTGAAGPRADVIGAFFEEILRSGFKQDKGMYFTHDNLVSFMIAALDLDGLVAKVWRSATHPDNRLPYVIDPACGSGAFLLRAMHEITDAVYRRRDELVTDRDSQQFFDARLSGANPNYWAEHFIYGMDPKFVMAITAKVNMVLHGDGSAHIFKWDGLRPFVDYSDDKLKPLPRAAEYPFPVVESFDVVVSNPPFGITLSREARAGLAVSFALREALPSECHFLERWYQLLRPRGRLGVVIPESLLNSAETAEARLFLYRVFWIRAIVSLPRNLFVETPTLTSLLFAQKKARAEVAAWDSAWKRNEDDLSGRLERLRAELLAVRKDSGGSPSEVEKRSIAALGFLLPPTARVSRKGKPPLPLALPLAVIDAADAANHYLDILNSWGLRVAARSYVFQQVAAALDYRYPVYTVDEAGYKLSKRKERVRPNQLMKFLSESGQEVPNLHLADGAVTVHVDTESPSRVIDFMRTAVKWS